MKKWFEIFRTGKHTARNGNTKNWTREDLDKAVQTYDPKKHEAPIVIGHPKVDDPAYGWIEKLKRVGDSLFALPKQVVNEFAEAVDQGLYKKRSATFYPDGSLRNVGFLGAHIPAVKGLTDLEGISLRNNAFSEEGGECFEFGEEDFEDQEFSEEAEKLLQEKTELEQKLADQDKVIADLTKYKEDTAKLESEFSEAQKAKEQTQKELDAANMKIKVAEFSEFLNSKPASISPAMAEKAQKVYQVLDSVELTTEGENEVYEFAEGDKANPIELFKEILGLIPDHIEYSERATKRNADTGDGVNTEGADEFSEAEPERLDLHKQIQSYQEANKDKNINYAEARRAVLSKGLTK